MSLPEAFRAEYLQFRDRFEWAKRLLDDDDIIQTQAISDELSDFIQRWRGRTQNREAESALDELNDVAENIRLLLGLKFAEDLTAVIDQRFDNIIEQAIFGGGLNVIEIMKLAPAELRPKLEEAVRDYMRDGVFEAERLYREYEEKLESSERKFRQMLERLAVDWPDRVTPEIRQRLERADKEDLGRWKVELSA